MSCWLLWLVPGWLAATPVTVPMPPAASATSAQLLLYNAQLAMQARDPEQVMTLWLAHNSLRSIDRTVERQVPAFVSLVWVAMAQLHLCPDNLPLDDDDGRGAGIWPIALYNWLLAAQHRNSFATLPNPTQALLQGQQQRHIHLWSILNREELGQVRWVSQGNCAWLPMLLKQAGIGIKEPAESPLPLLRLLRWLLAQAMATTNEQLVEGKAVLVARDITLAFKQAELEQKFVKPAKVAVAAATKKQASPSEQTELTKPGHVCQSVKWSAQDWLHLTPERRLALFGQRLNCPQDDGNKLPEQWLAILEALLIHQQTHELAAWLGFLEPIAAQSPQFGLQQTLATGPLGAMLMGLEPESGFQEQAAIALLRGIGLLQAGQTTPALQAFAHALHDSAYSTQANAVASLTRRWLLFLLHTYRADATMLTLLQQLLPAGQFGWLVEQLWLGAALRADVQSFTFLRAYLRPTSPLGKLDVFALPLAQGRLQLPTVTLQAVGAGPPAPGQATAYMLLQWSKYVLQTLSQEDRALQEQLVPYLQQLLHVWHKFAAGNNRSYQAIAQQIQALLQGLTDAMPSADSQARSWSSQQATFGGTIHLAPSESPPWPFPCLHTSLPSALVPIPLQATAAWQHEGQWQLGWRLQE